MSPPNGQALAPAHVRRVAAPVLLRAPRRYPTEGDVFKRATVLYVPDDHGLLAGIENNHLDWRGLLAQTGA